MTKQSNVLSTHRTVPQDNPLPDQGQSATATYKTEDIPASSEVKGDHIYTERCLADDN